MRTSLKYSLVALAAVVALGFSSAALAAESTASTISFTGTLETMSGVSAPATLTVKVGATTYTVNVTATTTIVRRLNGPSDLSEFLIGDTVQVRGTPSNDIINTVSATWIKDQSVQRAGGTFVGEIKTLTCASNMFTFKPKDRDLQTVYLTTSTKIIRGGEKITCADLKSGELAKVIGLWRKADKRIDADRIIVSMQTLAGTISKITLTDGILPATITVDLKKGKSWTINVTATTKLYRKHMAVATIEEFAVGDKIEARGTKAAGNVLNAKYVRNNSVEVKHKDFKGTVVSVDAAAMTFVLRRSPKAADDITVKVTASTKYFDEHTVKTFTDIVPSSRLKILGEYNTTTKTLTATRVLWRD